jgi:hypothetical protein
MKKTFTVLFVAAILVSMLFTGCRKCVTCTESYTGTTSDYCGTSAQVKDFENTLIDEGRQLGQDWSCVSK